jgi:flagellar capping protein FliD
MAEYGEWNRKRATLSDVTAKSEYGVSRDFIIEGIEAGKLEYRDGAIWGNPYIRLLRSQLEKYITEKLGENYLVRVKGRAELRMIRKEISDLTKRLSELQDRKTVLEQTLDAQKAQ